MKPELKEILKPPFRHDHCGTGEVFVHVNKVHFSDTRIMQIRGWGFFQNFENGAELQDEFKDFAVAALNEKWERDFGEPLRWKYSSLCRAIECPTCGQLFTIGDKPAWERYAYCACCGRRLLPPKEADNGTGK